MHPSSHSQQSQWNGLAVKFIRGFSSKYGCGLQRLANSFRTQIQISATRIFSLVCFRLVPPHNNEGLGSKLNRELLDAVNSTGKLFLSYTVLSNKYILCFAVGAP